MSINSSPTYAQPAWLMIVLSIAPAIGLGICRFACALVLPDMRDSLGWSYADAGFMNTINAAGYLADALGAHAVIRRIGQFNTLILCAGACVLSLVISALTGDLLILGGARLWSGGAAALAFVAGGTLATHVAEAQPWVWGKLMSNARSGRVTALLIAITALGAMIPLLGTKPAVLATSAVLFGNAFFAVVSSITAFVRLNHRPAEWPKALAMTTISFGIGQTLGPIATGAIADAVGSLSYALNLSAAVLVAGAIACVAYATFREKRPNEAAPLPSAPAKRNMR
jgi:predicted MFS family arabinose efflux permease